jgi:polar amino acid transport system substrate-binding protein
MHALKESTKSRMPRFTGRAVSPLALAALGALLAAPIRAQSLPHPGAPYAGAALSGAGVPGFWDPGRRQDRPELPAAMVIRFLTETDYPPFDFADASGNPAGFNVDLARSLCEELRVACTVQMRRFDTLVDALASNQGDAIIASVAPTPDTRARMEFTDPYYRSPARFVARRDSAISEIAPERLEGTKVGVIAGTAHEAYLRTFFTGAEQHAYPTADAAFAALRSGQIELLFGDGIKLAFWLNGSDSGNCCAFRGGPFLESRYFGEGIGIAVRRGNDPLRQALNYALFQLWEKGRYIDLWLRYFPVSPF